MLHPKIHFDKSKEKGHPFAYHVYGTAISNSNGRLPAREIMKLMPLKIVHDFGKSNEFRYRY